MAYGSTIVENELGYWPWPILKFLLSTCMKEL